MNLKGNNCTAEFDTLTEGEWNALLPTFADASFYQTWAYGDARCGAHRVSRMVLRHYDRVVALAQIRVYKTPFLPFGIAYVHWGPLWQKIGESLDLHVLREAMAALKTEFVLRRKLMLRVVPAIYDCSPESDAAYNTIRDAGLTHQRKCCRTFLLDIRPPLEELRKGLDKRWRQSLNSAERKGLTIVVGGSKEFFDEYATVHNETRRRKRFDDHGAFKFLRRTFVSLPESLRPLVVLARHEDCVIAGLVTSIIGKTAYSLAQGTGEKAIQLRGTSNLVEWQCLVMLKSLGLESLDLNGINADANPGTYHYKATFCGRNGIETSMRNFECSTGPLNDAVVRAGLFLQSILWR
jgi:lipid II:glycine glycyltransferase (peptidoglycan interpeptide bridge formation enzyme)